jgi:hypothetical protein
MKMAVFWVVAMITLMMEAASTSETLVNFYQTTRRHNPEGSHLRTHRRENLKSYDINMYTNSDAHAQSIIDNDFIIIPPHDFEHLSRWYYRVLEVKKCELGAVTCGTTSIPSLMESLTAIV